ncbi:MAG TPA: LuxR C-terminal-related transcriptional regulator [Nitrococcus sp.]|nr:LuxR C-terminal-related transcriptional regulator [Nitrococcus sp.]
MYVVDPDPAVVTTLKELFSSVCIEAEYFRSAEECLARLDPGSRGCIIADAAAPGVSVATLQYRLQEKDIELPVIFLSYSGDVATAVMALKCGAADFLEKPFNGQTLLDTVHRAIEINRIEAHYRSVRRELRARFDALTPREWEVILPMVKGCSNRMIAEELGVSEKTVEVYRARIMRKAGAANLPELIRIAVRIDLLGELGQRSPDLRRAPRDRRQSRTPRR